MEKIEQRLVVFRETTGLSKKAFAESIGMDSGLYGRYEAGANKPSFETLEKIAARYPKLNLSWLVAGIGNMLAIPLSSLAANDSERVEQLERELERERAWTEKLYEENKQFRALGKTQASSDAADTPVIPMWKHEVAA